MSTSIPIKHSTAAIQITVTATATSLYDLMVTADAGVATFLPKASISYINPEGDVRVSTNATPTASTGLKIKADTVFKYTGDPKQLIMIASSNTAVNVEVFKQIS